MPHTPRFFKAGQAAYMHHKVSLLLEYSGTEPSLRGLPSDVHKNISRAMR